MAIAAAGLRLDGPLLASSRGDSRRGSGKPSTVGDLVAPADETTANFERGVAFIGVCCRPLDGLTALFSRPCGVVLISLRGELRAWCFLPCGVLLSRSYRFGEKYTLRSELTPLAGIMFLVSSCSFWMIRGELNAFVPGDLPASRSFSRLLMPPPWGDLVKPRFRGVDRRGLLML